MNELQNYFFQGLPGQHYALQMKLQRLGIGANWAFNGHSIYYIAPDSFNDNGVVVKQSIDTIPENKQRVSLEEFKDIVNNYYQKRIDNGDWWLKLNLGDMVVISPNITTVTATSILLRNVGKPVQIVDIEPFTFHNNVLKSYPQFNGDIAGYSFFIDGYRYKVPSLCFEPPINVEKIELISMKIDVSKL